MINFDDLSLEAFQVLRAYGKEIVLYDDNGNRVMEPSEARRFYLENDNILVSVLDDGDNSSIKVYLGDNVTVAEVMEFVTVLRRIATQYNVLFNVRKYNKQIVPRDFATQAAVQEQQEFSSMNIMEGMYGTSKSSYLKLENARMIVRHSARVNEQMIGGRGRSIHSIFVENALGERFLFPVNILSGARAMTQHVNQGGSFADEVGQQIIRMANDYANLSNVANHIQVNRSELQPEAMTMRESIRTAAYGIRRVFERLSRDAASYIRESAKLDTATALTESEDGLEETIEELRSFLMIEGKELSESVLETVCKLVKVEEDMRPNANQQDDAQQNDMDNQDRQADKAQSAQAQKPQAPVSPDGNSNDDNEDSDNESAGFHESADEIDNDSEEGTGENDDDLALAEQNEVFREFEEWISSFKPEVMFEQPAEEVVAEATTSDMRSGAFGDKHKAMATVQAVLNGQEPLEINHKQYKVVHQVKASQLTAGMTVLASYKGRNQGVDAVRIDGVTNDEEKIKLDSVTELARSVGAKSMKELGEKGGVRLFVTDLEDGDSGAFYYGFNGRFARGSGAEALTFYLIEPV